MHTQNVSAKNEDIGDNGSKLPGLYIHVPFCFSKCHYCDFYSITDLNKIDLWLLALEQEALIYSSYFKEFDTLYLGGGTPSLLSLQQFEKLFKIIYDNFTFTEDSEITIEVNPNDVTNDKLKFFNSVGINRISLGVQSFDDNILRFLGRRHTANDSRNAIELIRNACIKNLCVDLIYGIVGQSKKSLNNTLCEVMSYKPEHISSYQLTIKDGTHFDRMLKNKMIKRISENDESNIYIKISDFFTENGYIHYEVSSFAKEGFVSKHNSKYWNHEPYLGLSCSAHSFYKNRRWWNVSSIDEYIYKLKDQNLPIESEEILDDDQLATERIMLKFRTNNGIKLSLLEKKECDEIDKLATIGYINVVGDFIFPTVRGFLVADSLARYFV